MTQWTKRGLVFRQVGHADWSMTHAALPVARRIEGDLYRVYFSSRDASNRAQIGYFQVRLSDLDHILSISPRPAIGLGALGTFSDNGVTSSCIVMHEGVEYHYFTGWTLGVTVPFYFYVGLATSSDGGATFQVRQAPILERNEVDPFLTASPWVLVENGLWRMWYVSGARWELEIGRPKHYYHIRYAESKDGIQWHRTGKVCIDFASGEYAFARPCVLKDGGLYRMWYSFRGNAYRIGYAESKDGLVWERKDHLAGIAVSAMGWDSEMIEYAFVFEHGDQRYMLYNGNDYGKEGIGLAVGTEDE